MLNRKFTLTCADCGCEFEAKSTNAQRCHTCAGKRQREKNLEYSHMRRKNPIRAKSRKQGTMICESCGCEAPRNSANQKYCATCSVDVMYRRLAEQKRRLEAEARGELVIAHIGDTIKCVDCGTEMIKMNARHVRCANCREKHRLEKSREDWQKRKEAAAEEKRKKAEPPKHKTLAQMEEVGRQLHASYGQLMAPAVTVHIPPEFRTPREV